MYQLCLTFEDVAQKSLIEENALANTEKRWANVQVQLEHSQQGLALLNHDNSALKKYPNHVGHLQKHESKLLVLLLL